MIKYSEKSNDNNNLSTEGVLFYKISQLSPEPFKILFHFARAIIEFRIRTTSQQTSAANSSEQSLQHLIRCLTMGDYQEQTP
jgi:hypothetical protein